MNQQLSLSKMNSKMTSANRHSFSLGLNLNVKVSAKKLSAKMPYGPDYMEIFYQQSNPVPDYSNILHVRPLYSGTT